MKINEVLKKYHKKVAFPISVKKIRAAGYEPATYIKKLQIELKSCSDYKGQPIGL